MAGGRKPSRRVKPLRAKATGSQKTKAAGSQKTKAAGKAAAEKTKAKVAELKPEDQLVAKSAETGKLEKVVGRVETAERHKRILRSTLPPLLRDRPALKPLSAVCEEEGSIGEEEGEDPGLVGGGLAGGGTGRGEDQGEDIQALVAGVSAKLQGYTERNPALRSVGREYLALAFQEASKPQVDMGGFLEGEGEAEEDDLELVEEDYDLAISCLSSGQLPEVEAVEGNRLAVVSADGEDGGPAIQVGVVPKREVFYGSAVVCAARCNVTGVEDGLGVKDVEVKGWRLSALRHSASYAAKFRRWLTFGLERSAFKDSSIALAGVLGDNAASEEGMWGLPKPVDFDESYAITDYMREVSAFLYGPVVAMTQAMVFVSLRDAGKVIGSSGDLVTMENKRRQLWAAAKKALAEAGAGLELEEVSGVGLAKISMRLLRGESVVEALAVYNAPRRSFSSAPLANTHMREVSLADHVRDPDDVVALHSLSRNLAGVDGVEELFGSEEGKKDALLKRLRRTELVRLKQEQHMAAFTQSSCPQPMPEVGRATAAAEAAPEGNADGGELVGEDGAEEDVQSTDLQEGLRAPFAGPKDGGPIRVMKNKKNEKNKGGLVADEDGAFALSGGSYSGSATLRRQRAVVSPGLTPEVKRLVFEEQEEELMGRGDIWLHKSSVSSSWRADEPGALSRQPTLQMEEQAGSGSPSSEPGMGQSETRRAAIRGKLVELEPFPSRADMEPMELLGTAKEKPLLPAQPELPSQTPSVVKDVALSLPMGQSQPVATTPVGEASEAALGTAEGAMASVVAVDEGSVRREQLRVRRAAELRRKSAEDVMNAFFSRKIDEAEETAKTERELLNQSQAKRIPNTGKGDLGGGGRGLKRKRTVALAGLGKTKAAKSGRRLSEDASVHDDSDKASSALAHHASTAIPPPPTSLPRRRGARMSIPSTIVRPDPVLARLEGRVSSWSSPAKVPMKKAPKRSLRPPTPEREPEEEQVEELVTRHRVTLSFVKRSGTGACFAWAGGFVVLPNLEVPVALEESLLLNHKERLGELEALIYARLRSGPIAWCAGRVMSSQEIEAFITKFLAPDSQGEKPVLGFLERNEYDLHMFRSLKDHELPDVAQGSIVNFMAPDAMHKTTLSSRLMVGLPLSARQEQHFARFMQLVEWGIVGRHREDLSAILGIANFYESRRDVARLVSAVKASVGCDSALCEEDIDDAKAGHICLLCCRKVCDACAEKHKAERVAEDDGEGRPQVFRAPKGGKLERVIVGKCSEECESTEDDLDRFEAARLSTLRPMSAFDRAAQDVVFKLQEKTDEVVWDRAKGVPIREPKTRKPRGPNVKGKGKVRKVLGKGNKLSGKDAPKAAEQVTPEAVVTNETSVTPDSKALQVGFSPANHSNAPAIAHKKAYVHPHKKAQGTKRNDSSLLTIPNAPAIAPKKVYLLPQKNPGSMKPHGTKLNDSSLVTIPDAPAIAPKKVYLLPQKKAQGTKRTDSSLITFPNVAGSKKFFLNPRQVPVSSEFPKTTAVPVNEDSAKAAMSGEEDDGEDSEPLGRLPSSGDDEEEDGAGDGGESSSSDDDGFSCEVIPASPNTPEY